MSKDELNPEAREVYDELDIILEGAFMLSSPGDIADALRAVADEFDQMAEEDEMNEEAQRLINDAFNQRGN